MTSSNPSRPQTLGWMRRIRRRVRDAREYGRRILISYRHPEVSLGKTTIVEPDVRLWLAESCHVRIGEETRVRTGCELRIEGELIVGARGLLGAGTTIGVMQRIVIGDDCLIAERVSIRDHDHGTGDPDLPYHQQGYVVAPITLGNNVWIGAGAVILKGVTLGDNCVVGANAVVTRSFPAGTVVAGVPARELRTVDGPASRPG